MQYAVKRAYAPNRILFDEDGDDLYIYTIAENHPDVRSHEISLTLVDVDGNRQSLQVPKMKFNQALNMSSYKLSLNELPAFDATRTILVAELQDESLDTKNVFYFSKIMDTSIHIGQLFICLKSN